MAQIVSVRLSRSDNSPWGFRLQGGKDFGQPLLIQKVNGGSLAERGGLQVGDALIRVNNVEVADMRHKEAQDTIVRAGHNMEISLQRGSGSTWRPQVSPVAQVPAPASPGYASPLPAVTKTSLAAKHTPAANIGAGHNLSPKPFGGTPQVNGDSVKAIVNKQYNTPVGMYSEETIAETLSAQAEVLAGGAIGVNFMKNEKTYDSQKSEVFKMVQEVDKEPRSPEPAYPEPGTPVLPPVVSPGSGLRHVQPPEPRPVSVGSPQPQQLPPGQNICADCERLIVSHAVGGRATSPRPLTPLAREMGAQEDFKPPNMPSPAPSFSQENPPCSSCGKHIVGVFVRIKDKNLHVDCFKCATCGTSLKNVGYYSINNKLYCDIHAKLVARQNPPVPNFEPVTVPPGGRVPPGAFITSQLPTAAPHSPQPGTLAPLPFHAPRTTTSHVSPRIGPQTGSSVGSGPKPFGSSIVSTGPTSVPWSSPTSTPAAPFGSPPLSNIGISKPHPEPHTTVVWPPPSHVQTTTDISISQLEDKRLSICSEEVSRIASRRVQEVSCLLGEGRPSSPVPDRRLSTESSDSLKNVKSDREKKEIVEKTVLAVSEKLRQTQNLSPKPPKSPRSQSPRPVSPIPGRLRDTPELLDIRSKPHGLQSLLPPACVMRPMSPQHIVVFPPQIPDIIYPRSPTPKPRRKSKSPERCRTCPSPLNALVEFQPVLKKCVDKSDETNINKRETEDRMENSRSPLQKKEVKMEDVCLRESKTVQKSEVLYTKEQVQKMIHKEVIKALSIKNEREAEQDLAEQPISLAGLPEPTAPGGSMAFALSTASEKPFTPISFPKAMEIPSLASNIGPMETVKTKEEKPVPLPKETVPYFPPVPPPPEKEGRDDRTARALREVGVRSPLTEGFTIAPDRPYSPLPTFTTVTQAETVLKPVPSQRKPISLTSALKVAPSEVFAVPGKTAVPSGPIVSAEEVQKPSAFKPVTPRGINCVSPERVTKQGVNLSQIAEGGRMKEAVKSFESLKYQKTAEASEKKIFPYYQENVSPIPQPSRAPVANPTPVYIPQPSVKTEVSQEISMKSEQKKEQLQILVAKGTSQRPVTPSGLHPPDHLPYYQKNIGEIPVRNKSISPTPHPIRAPPLDPSVPQNKTYTTDRSKSPVPQYKSTTYSETKTYSAKVSSSKTATNICKRTDLHEPELEKLSPLSWGATNVRTVQNLSPITVRLPSPKPLPLAPRGEQDQAAIADVHIHKPRSTSPLPPTVKVDVKYPLSPSTVGKSLAKSIESKEHGKGTHQTKLGQPQQNIPKICVESDICGSDSAANCNKTCALKVGSESEKKSTGGKMISAQSRGEHIMEQQERIKNVQTRQETKSIKEETSGGAYSASQKLSEGTSCGQQKVNVAHSNEKYCNQAFSFAKTDGHSSTGQNVSRESTDKRQTMSTKFNSKKIDEHWGKTNTYEQLSKLQKVDGKSVNISGISGSSTAFHVQRGFGQPKGTFQGGQDRSNIASSGQTTRHGQNGPVTVPLPTIPSFPQTSDLCGTAAGGGGGGGGGTGRGTLAGSSAPKRGRGILNPSVAPGGRIPLCGHCNAYIRGPFITALGKIWCPEHFICVNAKCGRPLQDIGFVEESDGLYCEFCFERYLAPTCDKCGSKIKGDCLNAIGQHFHPECFCCAYCGKLFGNNPFFLEDALPYCENDWNELFTTKCFSCGFPIEAGDRWVEALSNNYHSQCFNCTMCKKNLEGQSFFAKGGRPFCKNHAR